MTFLVNLAPKFPREGTAMSLTPVPLPLPLCQESAPLGHFYWLRAMNAPLPAELKFGENTGTPPFLPKI